MEKTKKEQKAKQSPAKRSKKDKITIIVGCSIIAVALVIGLLMVFVPKWLREGDMEDLIERMTAPDPQSAVLVDLLPEGGSLLTDSAVQIELTGESLALVMSGLRELAEKGIDEDGETTERMLTDLVLRVRTSEGEFLQIGLGENRIYCYEGAVALLFTPDDPAAYGDFYRSLEALFKTP